MARTPRRDDSQENGNSLPPRRAIRRRKRKDEQANRQLFHQNRSPLEDLIIPAIGPFTNKQKDYIKHLTYLPDDPNSKYIAFLLAGFTGCKEDCDMLANNPRMVKAVYKLRRSKFMIDESRLDKRSTLTEKKLRIIELALSKGMTIQNACFLGNVTSQTFDSWMDKGKIAAENGDFENQYAKVFYRVNRAKPQGELELLETIHSAALGHGFTENKSEVTNGPGTPIEKIIRIQKRTWQAAAWILEKTRKEHYGKDAKIPDNENTTPKDEAQEIFDALDMLINNQIEDLEELEEAGLIDEDDE